MRLTRLVVCSVLLAGSLASGQWLETTVGVDSTPWSLCYNPTSNKVYCANRFAQTITIIDGATNAVITTLPVFYDPFLLCHNPLNNDVYCTALSDDMFLIIHGDSDRLTHQLSTYPSRNPWMPRVNTQDNKVYVACVGSNNVLVYDGSTYDPPVTIGVGSGPEILLYNPGNNRVYCANVAGHSISAIDGAGDSVRTTIPVGNSPQALCFNPQQDKLYATDFAGTALWVVDAGPDTVVDTVSVGYQAREMCYNPLLDHVYCAASFQDSLVVIDGATNLVLTRVLTPAGPGPVCYNGVNNKVYCACTLADSVVVLDCVSNAIVARIGVGAEPRDFVWNPVQNRTYVANRSDGTISVLRDSVPVPVEESPGASGVDRTTTAAIVCGVLFLSEASSRKPQAASLSDISGRKVMDLKPGANDVRALAPGVYFVREVQSQAQAQAIRKVVVTR